LSYAAESIVGNGELIKKVRVAKLVFPVAAVVSNMINFLLSLIPLVLIVLVMRHPMTLKWFYLPVALFMLTLFTLGATFFFATANVYYRDMSHILQIVLQVLFYVTPVIYSLEFFPPKYRIYFKLNPLQYFMNGFRLSVYYGMLPTWESVLTCLALGLGALYAGFALFRRKQDEFVFYV
jgi:ABC-type polysaccharide/polyol phosphate export permease